MDGLLQPSSIMLSRMFNRKWITPIIQLTTNADRCKLTPMLWTGLRNYLPNDRSTTLNQSAANLGDTRQSRTDFRNRTNRKVDSGAIAKNGICDQK